MHNITRVYIKRCRLYTENNFVEVVLMRGMRVLHKHS